MAKLYFVGNRVVRPAEIKIPKESKMGLNERRKIKELQETTLPGRVKEIEEICGKPIEYEVDLG